LLEGPFRVRTEDTSGNPPANKLAFPTKPLAFRNIWNPITFLVNSEVASITEDNRIGILTVAIITHCTFAVLFFTWSRRLSVDSGS
jgi:hypothetical protein